MDARSIQSLRKNAVILAKLMNKQICQSIRQSRETTVFKPVESPVAHSIVNYRFGTDEAAIRPDRVMRYSSVCVLLQTKGTLFSRNKVGIDEALPQLALLGPTSMGQIWSTTPETEFTLIHLAPSASQSLFGLDPREIANEIESLQKDPLSTGMTEHLTWGNEMLHEYLCSVASNVGLSSATQCTRIRTVLDSMANLSRGESVTTYANHYGLTIRTLQRMVRSAVGLTPRQVLAIGRIRKLVALTACGWLKSRAELAQAAGFFDQSHLRQGMLRQNFGSLDELLSGDHLVGTN